MARTTLLTGVLVASWIGFSAVVLLLLPSDLMGRILGDTWNVAEPVLPILLAASVVGALAIGAFFGARAWRGAGQLLRVRVLISPIQLLALPIAAASAGANAYAYGVIFLAVVQLLLYWRVFTRLDRAAAPSGVATSIT